MTRALRIGPVLALLALTACSTAILAPNARAQSKTGTTFGAFLRIEPDARAAAMGNAGVTSPDGLAAAYFNPAAVASLDSRAFSFDHADWFADIRYDHVGFAMPVGRRGNVYATVTSLNSGDIDVRTVSQPLGTGEKYSVSDVAIGLGFAHQFSLRFSAGLQVNYVQETIWNSSAATATITAGTLFRVSKDGLRIGASLSNFGTSAAFDGRDLRVTFDADPNANGDNGTLPASQFTDPFAVPVVFRVGVGQPFVFSPNARLELSADALHPSDNRESVSLGSELVLHDALALRAGWQEILLQDSELGPTAGFGVRGALGERRFHLDYAWADQGRLQDTHRFSLGINF